MLLLKCKTIESFDEIDLAKRNGILFPKLFEPKQVFVLFSDQEKLLKLEAEN